MDDQERQESVERRIQYLYGQMIALHTGLIVLARRGHAGDAFDLHTVINKVQEASGYDDLERTFPLIYRGFLDGRNLFTGNYGRFPLDGSIDDFLHGDKSDS